MPSAIISATLRVAFLLVTPFLALAHNFSALQEKDVDTLMYSDKTYHTPATTLNVDATTMRGMKLSKDGSMNCIGYKPRVKIVKPRVGFILKKSGHLDENQLM